LAFSPVTKRLVISLSPDVSVVIALLGLSGVLFLWREPLDWVTKAVAFTMADLAICFGIINGYFGTSLTNDQKIALLILGVILILVAFPLSFIITKSTGLPKIEVDIPNSLQSHSYRGRPAKYFNVSFRVTSRFQKKATNCEGKLVFKPKSKDVVERHPLAWIDPENRPRVTIVKGNPKTLRVFLLTNDGKGACLVVKGWSEGHFPSLIDAEDYDYFRIEMFCEEWTNFKTIHEWSDVRFPDFLESLPTK
jgi:hypothetical protein